MALDQSRLLYIHGLEGDSRGVKATLLRRLYPHMLIPDFSGSLEARQTRLEEVLGAATNWTLVGSSLGGLMASSWAAGHPQQARRLALLAPALIWPDFANNLPEPIDVPTIVIHGLQDTIVPLERTRPIAERLFRNLTFLTVDDDHGLYLTVHRLNWAALLGEDEGPFFGG